MTDDLWVIKAQSLILTGNDAEGHPSSRVLHRATVGLYLAYITVQCLPLNLLASFIF